MPPDGNVPGETLLAIPPINGTVMEGEPISFVCVARDPSSIITWFHNGVEIAEIKVRSKILLRTIKNFFLCTRVVQ